MQRQPRSQLRSRPDRAAGESRRGEPPGPEKSDSKLAVVWVYSASCPHFQMFGPWADPTPHFATPLYGLCRSFQEDVHPRGLDFLLVKITHTFLGKIDSKGREEGARD